MAVIRASRASMSIFRFLSGRRRKLTTRIAAIVIIRHLTCPHCSAILGAKTLGLVAEDVDPEMFEADGVRHVPNVRFRETHLANPLKCPVCGNLFYAFVGIKFDTNKREIKGIDIKVARPEDKGIEQLINWPHQGLVMKEVIEYTPFRTLVYDDIDHFEKYNIDKTNDIVVSSLASETVTLSSRESNDVEGSDEVDTKPPKVVRV